MEIVPLSMVPELCPVLAEWAYNQWYRDRAIAYETLVSAYRARALDDILPWMIVALVEGSPAGMATLKEDDLRSRSDLNPWLSGLYVPPSLRERGIGHALVRRVIGRAGELGYARLFLFTGGSDPGRLERYYGARGWEFGGRAVDNDGYDTVIMRYDLCREATEGRIKSSGSDPP
jgi:GNAT superfamily N-acetyltransferase